MQPISFSEWQIQSVIYKDLKTTIQLIRHLDKRMVRKVINIGSLGDVYAKQELEFMKQIKHTNVVTCIHHEYHGQKKDILHVYMPYYSNSDLHNYLSKNKLSFEEKMSMFIDILVGLQQLHSRFIIHRDIKLKNIFVDEDKRCVVGDLGISTTSLDDAKSQIGTICFNAPQIYSEDGWYSEKVDLWAVGIIAYQLFNADQGKIPFPFIEPSEMLPKISPYRYKIDHDSYVKATESVRPCIKQVPREIESMIQQMLQNDPKKRISWSQFYEEGFLNVYDKQNRLSTFKAEYKLMETTKAEYKRRLQKMKKFKDDYFLKLRHILRQDNRPFFKQKYPIIKQELQAIYRTFLMMLNYHAEYYKEIRDKRLYKDVIILKPLYKAIARQIDTISYALNGKDKKIKSGIDFDSRSYFNEKFRLVTELLDEIDPADFKGMERIYQ